MQDGNEQGLLLEPSPVATTVGPAQGLGVSLAVSSLTGRVLMTASPMRLQASGTGGAWCVLTNGSVPGKCYHWALAGLAACRPL